MSLPAGKYFIDGKDFWTVFNVVVESGSDGFLQYPSKKVSITRDWADANGLDVDTSQVFFNAREISLKCAIITDDPENFWINHKAFIAQWALPGLHRIQLSEFGLRSYYCIFSDSPSFERYTSVREGEASPWVVACKFTINITELEPDISAKDVFIVDHDGKFLIC
jgi:hypothetical protein